MKNSVKLEQTLKVISIFGKYIPEKSKKKVNIDSATRRTIHLAFETKTYDMNVFDLAYEKAYQTLKFDHMPLFLISDNFMLLEETTSVRRGSAGTLIEIKAILLEDKARIAFTMFLQGKADDPKQLQHLRLWEDIHDYEKDYDKMKGDEQNKRAKKMWETIQKGVNLPSHLRVTTNDNVNGNKNPAVGPGKDSFHDLTDFLLDMLQAENQRSFLVSKEYQDFLLSADDDYKLDSTVLTLSEFKEDRKLNQTKDEFVADLNMMLRLENVLEDSLLTAYFRRFLRLSFQEENYLFFQDVQDMKFQHYIKAASGEISPEMTLADILGVSAKKIFDKFIKAGAMFQVNISASIRDRVIERVETGDIGENIYDDAQREIFKQMKNGGFMEFKKHDLFENYKKAHKRKFVQRSFCVGFNVRRPLLDHHVRKESELNFEELGEDQKFNFEEHLEKKKREKEKARGQDLDYITAQNVKDFDKDFKDSDSEGRSKGGSREYVKQAEVTVSK